MNLASPAVGVWSRLVGLALARQRADILALAANALLLPAALIYVGLMINTAGQRADWIVGALVTALGSTCVSLVYALAAADRFRGGLALIRTLPVTPLAYATAHLTYAVGLAVAVCVAGAALGAALAPAPLAWPALAGLAALALLAGLTLGGLGLFFAGWAPDPGSGDAAVSACSLALAAISPVIYPLSALPPWLQPFAWLSPYTHVAVLAGQLIRGSAPSGLHAIALCAMAAAAVALSVRQTGREFVRC